MTNLHDTLSKSGFKMVRLLIWEKTNPVPINSGSTYLSNSREIAVCAVKGGRTTFNSKYDNGIYSAPIPRHGGNREHPTQKDVGLFNQIITKHSKPGDLVLDPFLGSGTTAVASKQTGRNFRGCDMNPKYVKIAKRRYKANV